MDNKLIIVAFAFGTFVVGLAVGHASTHVKSSPPGCRETVVYLGALGEKSLTCDPGQQLVVEVDYTHDFGRCVCPKDPAVEAAKKLQRSAEDMARKVGR